MGENILFYYFRNVCDDFVLNWQILKNKNFNIH